MKMRGFACLVAPGVIVCLAAAAVGLVAPVLVAQEASLFPLVATLDVEDAVADLCFAPSGGQLVVSGQTTAIFDTGTWGLVRSFPQGGSDLAISPDSTLVASRGAVLEMTSGKSVWSGSGGLPLFSADGALLVVGTDPIQVWDVPTWTLKNTLEAAAPLQPIALALDSAGDVLYGVTFGLESVVVEAWDLGTGTRLPPTTFSLWDRAGLATSPLFSNGQGLALGAWNLDSAELRSSFPILLGPLAGAVAGLADMHLLGGDFAAAALGGSVQLLAVANLAIVASLSGDPAGITALAASADGTKLAAGGRSGRVDVWDISALLPYSCAGFTISKVDWEKGCVTLRNDTEGTLDLLGWTISDGVEEFTFPSSTLVEAGRTYTACARVYNPGSSSRGLEIDASDEAVTLSCPTLCGGVKVSSKEP